MVVSAMGHQTDVLVDLAKQITEDPSAREMDMLLSTGEQVSVALMAMGCILAPMILLTPFALYLDWRDGRGVFDLEIDDFQWVDADSVALLSELMP